MSESPSPSSPEKGKILFVDDEENILRSLQRLFMDEEVEVFTAPSGAKGLEILAREAGVGVIVSDQRMPEMLGVDFLEKSKAISPQSIRILLTGYADVNAAIDAINRGGTFRYLNKPWNDEELVQTVKGALQMYRLLSENKRLTAIVKKQNAELKKWNTELETIVQEQTTELRKSYESLRVINGRLRANFKNTIVAFSGLIELRDKRMRTHSRNVAEVTVNVAKQLGLESEEREIIMVAALLHDIGKIGIPDLMLAREAEQMNFAEREEYLLHPVRGQAAIDRIEELREAGLIIRAHHESYDGNGFPDGLKKGDIPLGARIIALADYIERKIRKAMGARGFEAVRKEVELQKGIFFDPKLVPVVLAQAEAFYKKIRPRTDHIEIELLPGDLQEGMEASRDVFSGTGILLLTKGTILAKPSIMLLKRYYELDPGTQGVFVSVKE
ncbi:HD domain-containing phosphohydrolase [Thiovibrio frasassiensis]|jgi:response regulator RpfG family c-di-GMP phosphodiesterase|uniref:HD domain-containing protein n=1 Tax=Thiovibrio frasassiensis TaxID=2984131 RepID=A0A9X4MFD0_9BACT|nr:HD domain-containing phosphohydrolase [Thiovibrio frasassiensis]MDG4475278.1 HD domain-containing protein [Thiovibrio frasassiensis]